MNNGAEGRRYVISVGIDTEEAEKKLDRIISKLREANSLARELANTELKIGIDGNAGSVTSFIKPIFLRPDGSEVTEFTDRERDNLVREHKKAFKRLLSASDYECGAL